MKWINQVDSAFDSLIAYSRDGFFVAWCDKENIFSCETENSFSCSSNLDVIRHEFVVWGNKWGGEDIRLIAATGRLRAMMRDITPYLFD